MSESGIRGLGTGKTALSRTARRPIPMKARRAIKTDRWADGPHRKIGRNTVQDKIILPKGTDQGSATVKIKFGYVYDEAGNRTRVEDRFTGKTTLTLEMRTQIAGLYVSIFNRAPNHEEYQEWGMRALELSDMCAGESSAGGLCDSALYLIARELTTSDEASGLPWSAHQALGRVHSVQI